MPERERSREGKSMRNIPKSATSIEDLTSTKRVVGTAMAMVLPFLCQVIRSGVDSYFGRLKRPSKKIAKIFVSKTESHTL